VYRAGPGALPDRPGPLVRVGSEQCVELDEAAAPARRVSGEPFLPLDAEALSVLTLDGVADAVGKLTVVVAVRAATLQRDDVILRPRPGVVPVTEQRNAQPAYATDSLGPTVDLGNAQPVVLLVVRHVPAASALCLFPIPNCSAPAFATAVNGIMPVRHER